ncbi:hypothetical protein Tco_1085070 [Tanacetum coccineum]
MSFSLGSSSTAVTLYMDPQGVTSCGSHANLSLASCAKANQPLYPTTSTLLQLHVSRASHVHALLSITTVYLLATSTPCLAVLWTPLRCLSAKTTRVPLSTTLTVTAALLEGYTKMFYDYSCRRRLL